MSEKIKNADQVVKGDSADQVAKGDSADQVAKGDSADQVAKDDSADQATKNGGRVKIVIPSNSGKGGSDDVFVSVNGRDYLIKRDAEASVPVEVLHALNDAVATEYLTDEGGRIIGERQVPRYSYQVRA